jgi:hypothetical protein
VRAIQGTLLRRSRLIAVVIFRVLGSSREGVSQLFVPIQVEVEARGTPGRARHSDPGDAVGVAKEKIKQRDGYRR